MDKRMTVDASVVLKWFLGEDYSGEARNLLKVFRNREVSLNAPDILKYEVGNAFWVLTSKRNQVTREYSSEAYNRFMSLPLQVVQLDASELREAFEKACELKVTLYDAAYLVTAKKMESTLVSADAELIEKAASLVDSVHIKELPF